MMTSITTICLVFVAAAVSTTHALTKPGVDFTSGSPAVAAEVNSQINTLYTALNNNVNSDGWGKTGNDIGYTAGRLGVGVTSPSYKLHITDASGVTGLLMVGGTNLITESIFASFQGRASVGYDGGRAAVYLGDRNASGTTATKHIVFDTGGAERMRIAQGGNVGIGITAPSERLHVSSDIAVDGAAGAFRVLYFKTADASRWSVTANNAAESGSDAGSDFTIRRYSDAGTFLSTPLFIRRSDGDVGIGTSSPATKLHVNGIIRTDNDVQLDGANGGYKTVIFMTAGNSRWHVGANDTMESGNTGSNFEIRRYNNGGFLGTPFSIQRGNGDVSMPGVVNVGSCIGCSDVRLKKNISLLENNLTKLLRLRGVSFEWRKPEERPFAQQVVLPIGKPQIGLLAQEVEQVFPDLVSANKDYYGIRAVHAEEVKTINYNGLIGPIIGAVQELKSEKDTQILTLQKRASEADARAAKLEKSLAAEQLARKQQEIRLAQLELRLTQLAQRAETRVVARR